VSEPSFDEFVAARATDLLRTGYLLTGDRAQAVDLLLTGLAAARRGSAQGTRLDEATEVARRAMLAAHTSWRRRVEVGHLLAESPLLSGMSALPGFSSPTADHAQRAGTGAALARLPARVRAALVLRYGEGRSEEETAGLLGVPVDDVVAATRRGLTALAEHDGGGDEGAGAGPADVEARLRRDLAAQAAEAGDAPPGLAGRAQERGRGDRRHLAGLLALLGFAVAVVLLVALTV
jgi:DNA-directed RNA polymerase specialized sigma24 family protein